MSNFLALCSVGCEPILTNELKLSGFSPYDRTVGRVFFSSNEELLPSLFKANYFLRTTDRIFLVLAKKKITNFDSFFTLLKEIEWEKLPNKFVLKCTTGSGGNIICKDKTKLDIKKASQKLNSFCKHNYYYVNREAQYKNIVPRIVCEKFISETEITPNDYKVYCFNGKARLLEFHIDRFGGKTHTCDYYDENLNRLDFTWGTTPSNIDLPYRDISVKIIELSEKISQNMSHARVDWYVVDSHIYFGEITLHNGGGYEKFDRYEDDLKLGSYLTLPDK